MTDLRQAPQYEDYLKSIGWTCLLAGKRPKKVYVYLKHIPFFGWFAKIQHPSILTKKAIDFVEKNYHPLQFSVEPSNNKEVNLLEKLNFKLSNSPSLPTKTLQIDLTKSEKELLKSFSQKTRYNITRSSALKRVVVGKSTKIEDFSAFWRENFEKKRFPLFSQQKNIIALNKSFGKNAHILLAKKDNKIIAVLFLLFFSKTAYYMYAATSSEGRKNFAPTLLTWEGIKLAKILKCKIFDFDGIYDKRFPISSWQGFTKFKKGFGGKEIEYPGCFVKTKYRSIIF